MKNGICPKCKAEEVYAARVRTGLEHGLIVDKSTPLLNLYKDESWWPDLALLYLDYFVCRKCGYLEMFVQDIEQLEKIEDSTNWIKVSSRGG